MKEVYESNRDLGDPSSIEGQLTENSQKMEKLRSELNKYQSLLEEVLNPSVSSGPSSINSVNSQSSSSRRRSRNNSHSMVNGSKNNRSSVSDESLSRSASDSSVSNPSTNHHKASAPGTPIPSQG